MHVKFLQKRWQKAVAIVAAAAVLGGGGLTFYRVSASASSTASTTTFTTATVKKQTISTSISASGTVADSSEYSLTAANAGTVSKLLVKQGDTVKKGQVIAQIGDTGTADTVFQKQAALDSAENSLASAEASLAALTLTSPAAGRVKSLAVSSGDDISTLKDSLLVISTAGKMTAAVNALLDVGTAVTVTDTTTGAKYAGTVSAQSGQGSTVTIASDLPELTDGISVAAGGKTYYGSNLALAASKAVSAGNSSSKVASVDVSENQTVSKGQALLQLDATSAEQNIETAKSNVTLAQQQLASAKTSQSKDTIASPVNGTVAVLDVGTGDSVQTGGSIATVIDPNAMETVVSVDESDISKVKVGQSATVTLDAISGKTYTGAVSAINPIGTSTSGVTTYDVTVTIQSPSGIMVGMTTNVSVITKSKANALVVSSGAILEKSGTTGYIIDASKVTENGRTVTLIGTTTRELAEKYGTKVTIGMSTADEVEITDGAAEGEELAVPFTVNPAMLKSLSNSSSGSSNVFGGMGGGNFGGGNFSGGSFSGSRRSGTGTTGNTGNTGNTGGRS